MIRAIDDFMFETFPAFQRIANLFHYFGINHVTLAQLVMIIGAAFTGAMAWQMAVADPGSTGWAIVGLQGVQVILFLIMVQIHGSMSQSTSGFKNPLRQYPFALIRLGFVATLLTRLLLVLFAEADWWRLVGSGALTCSYYLLACDWPTGGKTFFDQFRKRSLA